jgi:HAD superfamily hydrolase (TIGR01549 family)
MDGTLLDNTYPFDQARREIIDTLRAYGLRVADGGFGSIAQLILELKWRAERDPVDQVFRILTKYDSLSTRGARLRRGALRVLRWLKCRGYRVGVISNSNATVVRSVLSKKRIRGFFDVVVSREDVDRMKPYPDMVFTACMKLRVDPAHTLVVGDSWVDVEAALKSGAKTAYLNVRGAKTAMKPTYELKSINQLLYILCDGGA